MIKTAISTVQLAIVVPTYNEGENIEKLIEGIKKSVKKANINCEVLIVDDNSPDGTGKLADNLSLKNNDVDFKVKVLHRLSKQGFGSAYIAGFGELLKHDVSHIMQMDADLSHDPKYIPQFVEAAKSADMVIGSRYIKGGQTPDWSFKRKILSRFGNLYIRLFFGNIIHDYTGGYNLFSRKLLDKIDTDSLVIGYGLLIEVKLRALNYTRRVKEIPIIFVDRKQGKSKFPYDTIFKNITLVLKLAIKKNEVASY